MRARPSATRVAPAAFLYHSVSPRSDQQIIMMSWRNRVFPNSAAPLLRLYGTARVRRVFARNTMVAFGGISAVLQFVGQFFPRSFPGPGTVTVVSVAACLVWGLGQARPIPRVEQVFRRPDLRVVVE